MATTGVTRTPETHLFPHSLGDRIPLYSPSSQHSSYLSLKSDRTTCTHFLVAVFYLEAIQARDGSDLENKSRDTALKWIRINRAEPNSRFITVLDDINGEFKKERMMTLFDDSDAVVPWSERDDLLEAVK